MANILIVTTSNLDSDIRVLRQIDTLKRHYAISVVSPDTVALADVTHYQLNLAAPRRSFGWAISSLAAGITWYPAIQKYLWAPFSNRLFKANSALLSDLQQQDFDLVIANDVTSIPLASSIGGTGTVLLDAHEYAPEQDGAGMRASVANSYKTWLCNTYLPDLKGIMTVSDGIAQLYASNFGVPLPEVVRNTPTMEPHLSPSAMGSDTIELVHHGISTYRRGVEELIRAVDAAPSGFRLHLVISDDLDRSTRKVLKQMRSPERVVIHPAVPVGEIPGFINQFDVAFFAFPADFANSYFVLPNKFFEAVQARLGVVSAPSPDLAHHIEAFNLGVVASGFDSVSLGNALSRLTPDAVANYKSSADAASRSLCWESEEQVLLRIVAHHLQEKSKF